jgi:hypothetical protein
MKQSRVCPVSVERKRDIFIHSGGNPTMTKAAEKNAAPEQFGLPL